MFWYFTGCQNQKYFAQWALNMKTIQLWLLLVRLLPEPIKESSLLSQDSQQRQPPLPMRLPPGLKALRHRSLPHPDLRCYEATLKIRGTIFLLMRASLDPYAYKGVHLRDMIKLFSAL
jgi:hypothetical protein